MERVRFLAKGLPKADRILPEHVDFGLSLMNANTGQGCDLWRAWELKQLEEECEQVKVDIRSAGQRSAEVTRQARGVYEKWFEENQAEEKAEKDAAEKEAQRRQAEVDAKIQAQENWKLLQEEKERAIAAEKRAFDEKVKLKRAKSKAQMSSKPESP